MLFRSTLEAGETFGETLIELPGGQIKKPVSAVHRLGGNIEVLGWRQRDLARTQQPGLHQLEIILQAGVQSLAGSGQVGAQGYVLTTSLAQCRIDRRAAILHAAQHHRHLDAFSLGLLLPHGLAGPERARATGVEMPIAECVVALLDGRLHAADAVARLMEREPTVERL